MKHAAVRLAFSWLLFAGSQASLKAEIVESDITFQIKTYDRLPYTENGDRWSQKIQVLTYKTGDVAQKLAAKKGVSVSTKARLIQRTTYQPEGVTVSHLVRDKGRPDVEINASDISLAVSLAVSQGSGSVSKDISKSMGYSNCKYDVALIGAETLSYSGTLITKLNIIASKEAPERRLSLFARSFSGNGVYNASWGGPIQVLYSTAVIKYNPGKVLR